MLTKIDYKAIASSTLLSVAYTHSHQSETKRWINIFADYSKILVYFLVDLSEKLLQFSMFED